MYNEFIQFNEKYFNNISINGKNLSSILDYSAIDMLTNIENNIKLNFFNYVRQYVNSTFKLQFKDQLEKSQYGEKTELKKLLKKDLYQIKEDMVNNTLNSNNKYHNWIIENRNIIYPLEYKNSYQFDIKHYPQKYLTGKINKKIFDFLIYFCS